MHRTHSPAVLMIAALAATAFGQRATSFGDNASVHPRRARFVPGQMVLRTMPGVNAQELVSAAGGSILRSLGDSTYLLRLAPNSPGASNVGAHPGTRWAEPNFLLSDSETRQCGPTAGIGGQQCTVAFYDGNPAPERYYEQPTTDIINLGTAQDLSLGVASVVAVIDTGIDPSHPVFAGRILSSGYDFIEGDANAWDVGNGIDDDRDGLIDEAWGHGTHVSGIIALINPDAVILPLRVLDSDGNGSAFNVALAIHAAVDQGADIINLSLGMSGSSAIVRDAIAWADEMDVTVIAAAGNTGGHVLFPGRLDHVIGVAALDANDMKTSFSAYGEAVEVSAPGLEIYSAMPGNAWAWWSGTSMSAAVVSGATSLLHSIHGDPAEADGADALEDTSVDIDPVNLPFADLLGDGRIDVAAGALWIIANPD